MKNDTKRSRLPLAAGLILFAAAALWAQLRVRSRFDTRRDQRTAHSLHRELRLGPRIHPHRR